MPDEHTRETAEVCVPGAERARGAKTREADREATQGLRGHRKELGFYPE